MKHPAVMTGLIVSIGLLASTVVASFAVHSLGKSIERAASIGRSNTSIPDTITVRMPDIGTLNLRVANGGGGGEAFRVEGAAKTGG